MGAYLSQPVTEKESAEGQNDHLAFGLAAMQGWRVSMEDAHIAQLSLDNQHTALFAVFDGHGGKAVAHFAANHMPVELVQQPSYAAGDLTKAMAEAYYRLDELLDTPEGKAELDSLAGGDAGKDAVARGLFSDLEEKLVPDEVDDKALSTGALADEESAGDTADESTAATDANPSPAEKPRTMRRIDSTEKFRASALQRHSVIFDEGNNQQAVAEGGGGAGKPVGTDADKEPREPMAASTRGKDSLKGDIINQTPHKAAGAGCTAVAALIRGDEVIVANTGDSRCIVSQRGVATPLTLDHKPILYEEAQRIIRAGGFVKDNRVNGALNVSRTIGDLDFKRNTELPYTEQLVVATPDVEVLKLESGTEFLILACDGIWDVMSNQEAVDFVRKRIKQGQSLKVICEAMCDACLAPDLKGLCRGADNMSVIVVLFRKYANLTSIWRRMGSAMTGVFKS